MAMSVPKVGIGRFMKDGVRVSGVLCFLDRQASNDSSLQHFRGIDEAVLRNIEACVELAATTRSCYGPKGMSKMVINHLEKLFVTNDAAMILHELDVQHPAAKMLVRM